MCGVIGLVYAEHHPDLGRIAADLLKSLEYRGYDSTGAAVQDLDPATVTLVKGVGAPSALVHSLGITKLSGRIFCGQVRWATFGAVTDANSQPHQVRCKTHIYGAHNGNVTNCDEIQQWLRDEGHQVLSDNDGEMVVHTIEHYFALELAQQPEARAHCMRLAILRASERLQGSYAAVIVDPENRTLWAIKRGSSLYFGFGSDPEGGDFAIASSDLSAVLKLTRVLLPLREGEMVEFSPGVHRVLRLAPVAGLPKSDAPSVLLQHLSLEARPVRSRLRAADTALLPPFETFMDQEIQAQVQTVAAVITLFGGGSEWVRALAPHLDRWEPAQRADLEAQLDAMLSLYADDAIRSAFDGLLSAEATHALTALIPEALAAQALTTPAETLAQHLASGEAGFIADLLLMAGDARGRLVARLLDALLERAEVADFEAAVQRFVAVVDTCLAAAGRIYVVCCGTSYNAALAAALFFNELACTELIPILPGDFRGQYAHSLRDGDVFIAVSQSGETKDLLDVINHVIDSGRKITRIALVNNVNSTLAQEKSDLVIPLRCGPEVAVPATKSFMNQLTVFYCLALRLAEARLPALGELARLAEVRLRQEKLGDLPLLLATTFDRTDAAVERAAQLLHLAPSLHILATRISAVAKEGALKIREVVLNHTEGFEGSEFKHGPNTILGFNTVWGPEQVDLLLRAVGRLQDEVMRAAIGAGLNTPSLMRLARAVADGVFAPDPQPFTLTLAERAIFDKVVDHDAFTECLRANYPLIYVTGPRPQDVNLTISQINTHKIRGASTVVIAEHDLALQQAALKAPADNPTYQSVVITLPRTDDTLMTVFSATVVLQRLALKMSLLKAHYLDHIGIKDHGVHPDVPKNVSKSITVD